MGEKRARQSWEEGSTGKGVHGVRGEVKRERNDNGLGVVVDARPNRFAISCPEHLEQTSIGLLGGRQQ